MLRSKSAIISECGASYKHCRKPRSEPETYRLLWPREAFFIFCLFSPRAPVRGAFGAAFLRAARFTFLRSWVSVMLLVFAINLSVFLEL